LLKLCSVVDRWMNENITVMEWYWCRKTEVLEGKPVPMPYYALRVLHWLAWDCTPTSVVRGQWQTALVTSWPLFAVDFVDVYNKIICCNGGPGSLVSIATELQAGWSRIESWWGQYFLPVQTGPGVHPASCTMGTGSFPGVKCSHGVLLTTYPLLVLRSWKSRAISVPTLWTTAGL